VKFNVKVAVPPAATVCEADGVTLERAKLLGLF
jgi:hypothetical protein